MMKSLLVIVLLTAGVCPAQDMVRNGSFELYSTCPNGAFAGALDSASYWSNPAQDIGSPDYFNACGTGGYLGVPVNFAGFEPAYEGNAYAGMLLCLQQPPSSYREYIENELLTTLGANKCYRFEMQVSVGDGSQYNVPEIHVYFSDTLIANLGTAAPLPFTPHLILTGSPDTSGWTTYAGNYTAAGTENYVIIGNFLGAAQTNVVLLDSGAQWPQAYVYIDNVSLQPCSALGLDAGETGSLLTVSPNPAAHLLTIDGLNQLSGVQSVKVTTASGVIVPINVSEAGIMDVSGLAAGVYFLSVTHTGGKTAVKFVKE